MFGKEIKTLQDNNIKLNAIGNLEALPKKAQRELNDVIAKTKENSTMTLTLALSYGSREEITKTIKGTDVTRDGSTNNKALYIKQDEGDYVLKLENEVEKVE